MSTIYFATNRKPNRRESPTNFGKDFHPDGLSCIRFGQAVVKKRKISLKVAPEKLVLDRSGTSQDTTKSKLGSTAMFEELRQRMTKGACDTLVFVHGYNVDFREAMLAAAELSDKLAPANAGKGITIGLFSWPSDGSMAPWLAYSNDRRDAAASGPALARVLLKFADFLKDIAREQACEQNVHLMAHSMGNYVLRHAVQEFIAQSHGRLPRVFDQIFLMAADEDDDAFELEYKLKLLPRICRRVNVYFNREDRAMAISDLTKSNPDRLGDDGPRLPFQIPAKVTQIDCTPVVEGVVEHSYYIDTEEVVADLLEVLAGKEPHEIPGREFIEDRNRFMLRGVA